MLPSSEPAQGDERERRIGSTETRGDILTLDTPTLQRLLGQSKTSIDWRTVMGESGVVLADCRRSCHRLSSRTPIKNTERLADMAGMRLAPWYPLILVVLCVGIYGQTLGFDFVLYDDDAYLLENPRIRAGLTLDNLRWALTTGAMSNWHPLTWVSFLIDVELYGLNPSGFHLTNLLLHSLNSLVLYAFLLSATGSRTRSFIVAALFAVHPLHVESVAWVSERKGLLCGFFGLL